MAPTVIVGTGLAGYSLAREYRKLAPDRPILILTADDGRYYSKPLLSNAFTSSKTPESIANADANTMATQLDAQLRVGVTVTRIAPADHILWLGEETVGYERLVLALGADPIHIPVGGTAAGRVMSVNDLIDYTRFRVAIASARRVAIMGAGLIGCEFANDLYRAGIEAEVIDPAPYPLSRFVPEAVGQRLARELGRRCGVRWHFGPVVAALEPADGTLELTLSDGKRIDVDAVLSAVGLRPRTRLAREAGIHVGRGILVDRQLTTSAPDIYALGDCAEVAGLVLPFVMPIMHAARALARTLAGEPVELRYPAMPVVVKTTEFPVVVSPPAQDHDGSWEIGELEGGVRALYYGTERQLLGFALAGTAAAEKIALSKELPPVLS